MNKKFLLGVVSASFAVWYLSNLIADMKIKRRENEERIEREIETLSLPTPTSEKKDSTVPIPFYVVPDENDEIIQITSTQVPTYEPVIIPTYEPVIIPTYEPVIIPTESYVPAINYYDFVNEDVYHNFLDARNQFAYLYSNGEVSSQMTNNGTVLSYDEVNYIDNSMRTMYQFLNEYISYYENNQLDACYEKGKEILNYRGIDKQFLFDVLVSKNLPNGYRSGLDFNRYNIYDEVGNIVLNDGSRIRFIGGNDDIISSNSYEADEYHRMLRISEWYRKVPTIVLDEYRVIHDTAGDNPICYFWNQRDVERTCYREWDHLKKTGQSMYGFDPSDVSIFWDAEAASYAFVDQNNITYMLDYDSNVRIDHLFEVQDAMVSGEGDVYFLDTYLKNMKSYYQSWQYTK